MAKKYTVELKDLSKEEIETKTVIEKNGGTVYYLPVEIESLDQLETLGITRNQCRIWRCGIEQKIIHLTPCSEEVFRDLSRNYWVQQMREYRNTRCMVPGKQKALIRCPEKNKCSSCPFGISQLNRQSSLVSLDELIDIDREPCCEGSVDQLVCQRIELQELKAFMDEKDKRFFKVFILTNLLDYKKCAVARILHTSPKRVEQLMAEMKEIVRQFRDSYV